MSDQEPMDALPEPEPGENREPGLPETAPVVPEQPEERLGEKVSEAANTVTQELRDLKDELLPEPAPEPVDMTVPEEPRPGEAAPIDQPTPAAGQQAAKSSVPVAREGSDDDRLMAALAWLSIVVLQLPIVSVIQLFASGAKDQPFQRHHAVTSLLFFGVGIVYEILAVTVFSILTTVTLGCAAICLWPIFFVPHVLGLYYAFQAYSGKRLDLPLLTKFAKDQGWL